MYLAYNKQYFEYLFLVLLFLGGEGGWEGEDREKWGQGRTGERLLEAEVTQFACTMSFIPLIIMHIFRVFSIYFILFLK